MDAKDAASLVVSIVALVVALYSNRRSIKVARASQSLAVVKDIFGRRHEEDFVQALDRVRNASFSAGEDPDKGIEGLPEEKRRQAQLLMRFYDDLGKLVAHEIVDEDLVIGAYGHSVRWSWQALDSFILAQRRIHNTEYNVYFEHLAKRAAAKPPAEVHRRVGVGVGRPWWRRILS